MNLKLFCLTILLAACGSRTELFVPDATRPDITLIHDVRNVNLSDTFLTPQFDVTQATPDAQVLDSTVIDITENDIVLSFDVQLPQEEDASINVDSAVSDTNDSNCDDRHRFTRGRGHCRDHGNGHRSDR